MTISKIIKLVLFILLFVATFLIGFHLGYEKEVEKVYIKGVNTVTIDTVKIRDTIKVEVTKPAVFTKKVVTKSNLKKSTPKGVGEDVKDSVKYIYEDKQDTFSCLSFDTTIHNNYIKATICGKILDVDTLSLQKLLEYRQVDTIKTITRIDTLIQKKTMAISRQKGLLIITSSVLLGILVGSLLIGKK
jgi:hypothetical protein